LDTQTTLLNPGQFKDLSMEHSVDFGMMRKAAWKSGWYFMWFHKPPRFGL